jgi:hypothetical protein
MKTLRYRTMLLASAVIFGGSAYLATPVEAAETTLACTTTQISLARSFLRAYCGNQAGTYWFTCDPNGIGIWEGHYECYE